MRYISVSLLALLFAYSFLAGDLYSAVFPLSRKKRHFRHLFRTAADKNFENRHLHFLDAISFTAENFTKHNLNNFSKMYGTYFHDWSRSQVTAYRKFRRIFGNSPLARFIKKFWVHFPNICVSQQSCLPWSSYASFELSACKVYKNVLGAFSRFSRAKTKLLAVKSRRILEVFTLQVKKSSGRIFSTFASKNEGISREVQLHFGSSLPANFTEKGSGRNVTIYVSKNEAVFCEVQTQLGSFRLARFAEKGPGAFSWFLRPKTKLFAVELRRIFDVFVLHALYKCSGCIFTIYASKTNLFAVKFRRILEVLCL